eukprot:5551406-Karenia_brevis.AAC.1
MTAHANRHPARPVRYPTPKRNRDADNDTFSVAWHCDQMMCEVGAFKSRSNNAASRQEFEL